MNAFLKVFRNLKLTSFDNICNDTPRLSPSTPKTAPSFTMYIPERRLRDCRRNRKSVSLERVLKFNDCVEKLKSF